ncbi:hypothetical protein I9W82_005595 [Candida metapsilosis]|uniref:Uncharacterized protein n=1 Tax=Candida metapsilosis TaxID=273372 RepID=A0A8H7ZCC9_9ASCO|nr:hypothetical protein I9W82_005595 [Candida metapsilosis]
MPSNRNIIDSSPEQTPTPTSKDSYNQSGQSDTPALPSLDSLTIGTPDQITSLAKHAPLLLPNQSPTQPYAQTLQSLRCSYNYTYVMNWLSNYRGFLKLQSEYFDVDIFELELLNYFPDPNTLYENDGGVIMPQPLLHSALFVAKLKLSLMHYLRGGGHKSSSNDDGLSFEQVVRSNFGISTPLGGVPPAEAIEIKEDGDDIEQQDAEGEAEANADAVNAAAEADEEMTSAPSNEQNLPQFDYLLIEDKIEVLYIIISHIAHNYKFKDWIDRQAPNQPEFSRVDPIFITETTFDDTTTEYHHHRAAAPAAPPSQSQWLLLCDNSRLYKKTIHYPELSIPKKRKNSPEFPNEYYTPSQFDVSQSQIQFELIAKNIFELNDYVMKLKSNRFTTSPRNLISKLTKVKFIDSVFANEVKKRKFMVNKKKEVQLAGMLAVRKRSSRLEARLERERLERQKLSQSRDASSASSASTDASADADGVVVHRTSGGRRLRDSTTSNGHQEERDPRLDSQRRFERRQQRQNRWV